MGLIHRLARVLLSGIFISGGIDVLRDPGPRAVIAGPFLERLRPLAPALPSDPILVVRANAAIQLAAGATLAIGILPRLSALALAGSLVPTTIGAHRFWEQQGPAAAQQRTQFLKNAAILGGLILVANVPASIHRASEIA
jgi:putative oxidoreductase